MSKSEINVILLHAFRKKGAFGDIIKVKRGYAKNFLIPNKYALYANQVNKDKFDLLKKKAFDNSNKLKDFALKVVDKIKDLSISIIRNSAQDNKIFGTISTKDIVDEFKKIGVEIERKQIIINNTIKYLGSYRIKLALHPDVIFEKEIVITNGNAGNKKISDLEEDTVMKNTDSTDIYDKEDDFDN
jgi:large subunit ribosomal protein L9